MLELGCGDGELARAISAAGHSVLAIDPEAPEGSIFRRSTIEELHAPASFDAVVASRSLHHVTDLALALDKVVDLLDQGGVVVVDDFGWERLDPATADRAGFPLEEWRDEHEHLHTSAAMLDELGKRFVRRSFSWEPYLYREARRVLTVDDERRLIQEGRLQAIGFRYVGSC